MLLILLLLMETNAGDVAVDDASVPDVSIGNISYIPKKDPVVTGVQFSGCLMLIFLLHKNMNTVL